MRFLTYAPGVVIRAAVALSLALPATIAATAPAAAQGQTVGTFGDWRVACDTPPGAQAEQCALLQDVIAEDRDNVRLNIIVLKTADGQATLLRVIAPLGVLLPYGLGLSIDGTNVGTTEFVRCFYPEGCLAEVLLEDDLRTQMSDGTMATFVIFLTPEEAIGVPVSLNGFEEGFAALP